MSEAETIYAAASGHGCAGVAVIRVSGPAAGRALTALAGREMPPPRRAVRRRFRHPESGASLDEGLVLWFPGPASFTGEDVAEFHIHGGRAVREAVLEALSSLEACRLAGPGEFSRRAFLNGRMDLTAAEGLADLVAAETEAQRVQALRQMGGALAAIYEGWRERLGRALAYLEAAIDFAEEEIPADLDRRVRDDIAALVAEIDAHLADERRGERLREGISVAILGAPNVGKSTLLNALARRDAAIVSETAGTTRDVVEVHMDLGGYPVILADTAGIRADADALEGEGVRRALAQADAADIRLVLVDAPSVPQPGAETRALITDASLVVVTKTDLIAEDPAGVAVDGLAVGAPVIPISAVSGKGMGRLVAALREKATAAFETAGDPGPTRLRHREALEDCRAALGRYLEQADAALDLAGEDLRLAMRALGRITGRVDVEDLLDVIFRDFCIGK